MPLYTLPDLGTLTWPKLHHGARGRGTYNSEVAGTISSDLKHLEGAFFFKSSCHWIVSIMSGTKPRMARSLCPVHAFPVRRLGGNKTGSVGLLRDYGLSTRQVTKLGYRAPLGTVWTAASSGMLSA